MKVIPGYKQTEVGIIPEDWELNPIGDLFKFKNGLNKGKAFFGYGTPIVNYMDVFSRPGLFAANIYGKVDVTHQELDSYGVKKGDVFFTRTSETVEEIGVASVLLEPLAKGVFSGFILRARPVSGAVVDSFKKYCFASRFVRNQIVSMSTYTTRALTSGKHLSKIKLPLPPTKAEQEAIAEALSDTDAHIESLEQLLVKKRQLRQGAMQELLTGKKRLPGFNGEWEVKRFGEIVQPRKERIDPRRKGPYEFCIELEHIEQGTGCLIGFTMTSEDSSLKSVFQKDDVLFGKLRAYLRKYWLASREGVCSTEIWVLTAKSSLLISQFLFQLVKLDRFIEVASSAYGTHMPRSDWNVVKNFEVRLPAVPEQTAIAAILSDMDAEIATLEEKFTKTIQIKQGMMQDLLTGRIRLV